MKRKLIKNNLPQSVRFYLHHFYVFYIAEVKWSFLFFIYLKQLKKPIIELSLFMHPLKSNIIFIIKIIIPFEKLYEIH